MGRIVEWWTDKSIKERAEISAFLTMCLSAPLVANGTIGSFDTFDYIWVIAALMSFAALVHSISQIKN